MILNHDDNSVFNINNKMLNTTDLFFLSNPEKLEVIMKIVILMKKLISFIVDYINCEFLHAPKYYLI